ncbi:dystroglycan-like [Pecten maximus]|uniref:dystroglycan-like n=1 Tax=Pecten maximus TaxID=6579 RepID=UPI0014584B5B|nr:dystroglycan-like [Pecten maximus]
MYHSYAWLTGLAWLMNILPSAVHGVCQSSTSRGDNYNFLTVMGVQARHTISTSLNAQTEYQFVSPEYEHLWKSTLVTPLPVWLKYNETTTTVYGTPVEAGVTMVRLDLTHLKMTNTCNSSMAADLTIVVHDAPVVRKVTTDQCITTDAAPLLERPIDQLKVQVGRPFLHSICDTFKSSDNLDLTLMLTLPYGKDAPGDFWLQLDESAQFLYGLPLAADTMVTDSVTLVAMDTCGKKSRDAIHLDFEPLPEVTHTMTLTVTPAARSKGSDDSVVLLVHVVSKLENWFRSIQVKADIYVVGVEWKEDQLVVQFTLSGSSVRTCSKPYLEDLVKDMTLPAFSCLMAPMFTMEDLVSVNFSDSCVDTYPHSSMPSKYGMSKMKPTLDHWLEVVVPCAAFLLIVTVVVIVLMACSGKYPHRRKRYVLKSEIPTYLEDRKPIIFPDETRRKESSLEPRPPILIPGNGEYEPSPWQQDDGENGSLPLLRGTPDRNAPTPPEYLLNDIGVPPPYRLPPPYNSTHPTW